MADWQQLYQLTQQMQGRLHQLQLDLADQSYEVQAGAGMIRVMVDGQGFLRRLHIDPECFAGRDAELLADLIVSAVAEAQRRAAEAIQQEVPTSESLDAEPAALARERYRGSGHRAGSSARHRTEIGTALHL